MVCNPELQKNKDKTGSQMENELEAEKKHGSGEYRESGQSHRDRK